MNQTVVAMCSAGIALLVIGGLSARNDIAGARGLDKILAMGNLCFAIPLAVFGALHLFGTGFVADLVPEYMPWRLFWAYFVGCALIAASLSIATTIWVRWSGLLVGIMMFLFVAMIHVPGALSDPRNRIIWTIVFREMSFGGAGWILAANAMDGSSGKVRSTLMIAGRACVTIAVIFFGIEHFLHPKGLPGVPLEKQMPAWVPGQEFIDYLTGAGLLVAGASSLLTKKMRMVATCVGAWIVLMVLIIYGPVLIAALSEPDTGSRVVGINYFADTLLFAGVVFALAKAAPRTGAAGSAA